MDKLIILVEGNDDQRIITQILKAASYPLENVFIMVMGGKQAIKRYLNQFKGENQKIIALIDLDKTNIPDAIQDANEQLGNPSVKVCCAIPTIESWLFADDALVGKHAKDEKAREILERLPLPEEIPYPKYLASNVFDKWVREEYSFMEHINVRRASARCPSLKYFLSAVGEILNMPNILVKDSLARSMNRDVFSNLIKEVMPANTIIYRTLDGESYTAEKMLKEIEEGTQLGKEYTSDVLRVARDMLIRKAQREEKKL